MTQTNSRQRCKVDLVGKDGLTDLFKLYERQDLMDFKLSCMSLIEGSSGKRPTKDRFKGEINNASSKDRCLKITTNYILAGQGLGV